MSFEFNLLKKYLDFENKKVLSIGGGVGGLELLIGREFNSSFYFIEKNYISKKVRYGWDYLNKEAYNDLNLLNNFLISNNLSPNRFKIFDYDKNKLPEEKFDIIISLYSLDYHYNFNIYFDYLKKVSNENTIIVFDTIKPELFNSIFTKVTVIKEDSNTVHKSKRIMCRGFI